MSTQKTQNYNLHSWLPADDFLRTEINENFTKLDAALSALSAEKARVVAGTYTGDGASQQFISLGFTPAAVLVLSKSGQATTNYDYYGGLALKNAPVYYSSGSGQGNNIEVSEGGFIVHYLRMGSYFLQSNAQNAVLHFLAIA